LANENVVWKSMVGLTRRGPANLQSPIDYRKGRIYVRIHVRHKPTEFPVGMQLCMWADGGGETCSAYQELTVRTPGVYYIDAGVPDGWWIKNGGVDWSGSSPWKNFRLLLRCSKDAPQTGCIFAQGSSPVFYKGEDFESHVPVDFNVAAIVVAPGKRLKVPAEWWDCPAEWGCQH
jgi:hypothetical protein